MSFGRSYIFFFLLFGLSCPAQFTPLLHKKYSDKVIPINDFYRNIKLPYAEAQKKSDELKNYAKKNNDASLVLESELFLAYYFIFHNTGSEKEQVERLLKVAKKGKDTHTLDIEARTLKVLRDHYWYEKKNYEIGFEYGLQLDQLLKRTNAKDFPDLPEYYYIIGSCYYLFRDYETSINYFKKTLSVPENSFNWKARWNAANTLGLCYQKLNKSDSSNYYLKKSASSPFIGKESLYYTISMGNLAYNLYQKGNYEEAKPLFREDISNAIKAEDYSLASGSLIPLADIYIYDGKLNEAWKLLEQARLYIRKSSQDERYENLYPVISHWYDAQGMKEKAIPYKDSAIIAANNNNNTFNGLMLLRVQQKIDRQKLENAEQKLEQANRNRRIKTGLTFFILIVIVAFAYLYYFYLNKIYKEKNKTKEAELKFSQEKLENAKQEINNFLKEIENKNRLIKTLKNIDNSESNKKAIDEIKKTVILTDKDWEDFQLAFERIDPGYIERLKNKFPNITPAEVRMVVLSKLNLSHKEIGNILGISAQSSRVTWHRLRKKLNIDDGISLYELSLTV